jgi:hypothetical protein
MNTYQVLKDIAKLINGLTIENQIEVINKYHPQWNITEEEIEDLSDGEVLDIVFDMAIKGIKGEAV